MNTELLKDPSWIRDLVPEALRGTVVGVEYWQWAGLALLVFVGFVVDHIARALLRPGLRRIVTRLHSQPDLDGIKRTATALGILVGALVWRFSVYLLSLPGQVEAIAMAATGVFLVLSATLALWRLSDLAGEVFMHRALGTDTKFDDILVPMVRKTSKVLIAAFGIIYGAQHLNIDIVPLVTGLGIGGLAFAFAAKDTIENFFGSVAVILDRPFEVGDWVVIEDVEGTIEELGFRSTRLRTFYNSQVTIPNAALVRAKVDNLGRRQYRRWKTTLGVQYDTPPDKLLAFTAGIRELVLQHPYTRKDFYQVFCNDFGDFSLNILLYIFFETPDWATELRERERFFVDVVRLADQLGVAFAFPTQTVHLYKEEHQPHSPHYTPPGSDADDQARQSGVEVAKKIVQQQGWTETPPPPVAF